MRLSCLYLFLSVKDFFPARGLGGPLRVREDLGFYPARGLGCPLRIREYCCLHHQPLLTKDLGPRLASRDLGRPPLPRKDSKRLPLLGEDSDLRILAQDLVGLHLSIEDLGADGVGGLA